MRGNTERGRNVIGRHQRVLRILNRLKAGDTVNARDLARQWQVSRRTVYRDLGLLRDAGVPIHFDQQESCYRVAGEGVVDDTPLLGSDELAVLVAAVHFSLLQRLPMFQDQLERTTSKLVSGSPFQVRQSVSRLTRACAVGPSAGEDAAAIGQAVTRVLQAIGERRALKVVIASERTNSECTNVVRTRLSPYQMIATADTWQVVGRSSYHRAIRVFDPRRFVRVEITDHVFSMPRQYDLSS